MEALKSQCDLNNSQLEENLKIKCNINFTCQMSELRSGILHGWKNPSTGISPTDYGSRGYTLFYHFEYEEKFPTRESGMVRYTSS